MADFRLKEVPLENIPKFLEVLESKLPDTVVPHQWIKIQKNWERHIPGLKVRIFTVNGDWRDGSAICLADGPEGNKMLAAIYATEEGQEALKNAAISTNLIDWKRIKIFYAVLERNVPMLREILTNKGCKLYGDIEKRCFTFYLPSEKAMDYQLPQLPENVRVGPLGEQHLQILCENWPIFDEEYTPYVLNTIKLNLTVGVFVKNSRGEEELASMVMHRESGEVGLLQTVPEHRRKGYAEIALAHIIKLIGQKGLVPFATVIVENKASRGLFEKMNFGVQGMSADIDVKE
ncbi:uncharacterized protein LOC135940569 isoform X2 [Cloeon dipterum]|uniref:uncharacterized protein LOC135940569 isoform X2 n=1 Tax=Cloeon dipterum TaxID=197152 RepID=UPI00321F6DBE